VSWATGRAATLGVLLRSKKGMAAAFDRAIQEGVDTARRRFERLLQRLVRSAAPTAPGTPAPTVTDMQAREGDLLAEVERDLQAATDVGARMGRARSGLA